MGGVRSKIALATRVFVGLFGSDGCCCASKCVCVCWLIDSWFNSPSLTVLAEIHPTLATTIILYLSTLPHSNDTPSSIVVLR